MAFLHLNYLFPVITSIVPLFKFIFLISCHYIDLIRVVKHSRTVANNTAAYPAIYSIFHLHIISRLRYIHYKDLFELNPVETPYQIVRWWRFWTDFRLLFRPTFTLAERPEPERKSWALLPVIVLRCIQSRVKREATASVLEVFLISLQIA